MNPYSVRLKSAWQSCVHLMNQLPKVKSQLGGPGDIFVKKSVDWPQTFILTRNQKTRPTYDELSITQWVSGFVRCIQEEKSGFSISANIT